MSDPYKPGKPIVSVLFFAVLMLGLIEGSVAFTTSDACDKVSYGVKHWQAFPPKWVCDTARGTAAGHR